jgi:hypothetical protein
MKRMMIFGALLLASACTTPNETTDKPVNDKLEANEDFETKVRRHVEGQLTIPRKEKYTLTIHREQLDGDGKLDGIIAVNRLEFALEEAKESDKTAKRAEIGFMGSYNYFFYYDGATNKLSAPIKLPSSPYAPLIVNFEHITSEDYKDILIDYRVLSASYKDFYTITNRIPRRIFQWKNFDGLGKSTYEAYVFEYDKGTMVESRDIIVRKASLQQPSGETDIYTFQPELTPTNEIAYRFFVHPAHGKYVTMKQ